MKAILELDVENPEILKKSIEIDDRETERIKTTPKIENGKLIVEIDAKDFTALRAGVTTYLRLTNACLSE